LNVVQQQQVATAQNGLFGAGRWRGGADMGR